MGALVAVEVRNFATNDSTSIEVVWFGNGGSTSESELLTCKRGSCITPTLFAYGEPTVCRRICCVIRDQLDFESS